MKTVQQLFKEIDIDILFSTYRKRSEFDENEMKDFIEDMRTRNILVQENNILIATEDSGNDGESFEVHTSLIYKNQLLNHWKAIEFLSIEEFRKLDKKINTYAYEFNSREEILAYLVPNYIIKLYGPYEILADVIFEITFYGYADYDLESEIENTQIIKNEENECGNDTSCSKPFTLEDYKDKYNIPEQTEDEKQLQEQFYQLITRLTFVTTMRVLSGIYEELVGIKEQT